MPACNCIGRRRSACDWAECRLSEKKCRPRGRRFVNTSVSNNTFFGLLPVLLDARGAQAGKAMLVDGGLPGEEFLDRQCVTGASFFEGQQATAHGRNHLSLAADDPALCARRGQIRNRERTAVRPDHILDPRAMGFGHSYSLELLKLLTNW